jgi:hypothetical protein
MSVSLQINDKEMNRALSNVTATGLRMGAQFYHSQLKIVVNTPNTAVSTGGGRGAGGRFLKGRRKFVNPSKPGEAPRKRTGFGQRGIVREFDDQQMAARVGVTKNAIYMYYLEMGTRFTAKRPWLVSTLQKNTGTISALFKSAGRKLQ